MGHTFNSGYSSPLKNVSLYAIYKELARRELKGAKVKMQIKEDKYIIQIEIDKKEVDI